ncbi:MAG: F0F1 ATP synthase subunit B [Oscillospiraceae bacterium]|nr:F0F1 ATP synthase subunit B [Oscillospiraceae bacterium]
MNPETIFYFDRDVGFTPTRTQTTLPEGSDDVSPNPFDPDQMAGYTATAIMTVISLLVAYLILKRFVFKPIIKLLDKRRESVENELKEAEDKVAQANEKFAQAEKMILEARAEASDILSEARSQAQKQSMMIISEAKEEAVAIRERAESDATRMHRSIVEHMRDEVADLAVTISRKVIGKEISDSSKEEVHRMVSEEIMKTEVKSD